jgi:adenylate cyclase class IV
MSGKFFEFKIKVASEDEAKNKLGSLTFGEPRVIDVIDTYLITSPGATEKIYESGDKIFYTVVRKTKDGFEMDAQLIGEAEKQRLLNENKTDKVFKKQRRIWNVDGIDVVIDRVEGLGAFIEFQGRDKQKLLDFIKSLGFSPEDFVLQPYNKL